MPDEKSLMMANILGTLGGVVSPKGSPQAALGDTAANLAGEEQERRLLSELLGDTDLRGKHGLSPEFALQALGLRHQVQQAQPQPVEMATVETPFGPQQVPAEEAAEYRRKVWAEQHTPAPTPIRTFEQFQQMDEKTQQEFMEFSKDQRGKSFEEALAEFEIRRRRGAELDKELEAIHGLGTRKHINEVVKDMDISDDYYKYREQQADRGGPQVGRKQFQEARALAYVEQEMLDRISQVDSNIVDVQFMPIEGREGFYGITKEGERRLLERYTRRYPIPTR